MEIKMEKREPYPVFVILIPMPASIPAPNPIASATTIDVKTKKKILGARPTIFLSDS
jgi:hypothetical protein